MKKRIIAWILLIGFLLLIINLIFIGYQRMASFTIYAAIAAYFILNMGRSRNSG